MSDNVNYQLPPTEITDWVKWRMLWDLAMRMNLLSDVSFGPPTTPEEYQQLVSYINSLLNTGSGGNILPAIKQGSTLLPAVSQNAQALMAITPTDPANVGTISAQPIEGIVTGGGSIGTVIATVSGGSYGAVKRSVAALAAASIFATTILSFQMAQEKIDDLVTSLDPFADENGKTYLPHDVLEAVRQKLIEMGAYVSSPEIGPEIQSNTSYQRKSVSESSYTDTTIEAYAYNTYREHIILSDKIYFNHWRYPSQIYESNQIYNRDTGVYYPVDYFLVIRSGYEGMTCYPILSSPIPAGYYEVLVDGYSGLQANNVIVFTYNGKTLYTVESMGNGAISSDTWAKYGNPPIYNVPMEYVEFAALNVAQGSGVEGITIQEGATVPSDPNQTLEDYFPAWTGEGKVFNTVTLGADRAIQSIGETTFLPATLKDIQPIEEGTTQTQAQAQAGTPQENTHITNNILPAIQEFIDSIITSPDIPTPTIPAEDRGDSPTPVPPVITGAGSDLIAIYNPTKQELQDFNSFLWSLDPTQLVNWKKIFVNPIEAVIALQMIYVTPITGTPQHIKCGYIETDVNSKVVTNQYKDIDCGSVDLTEYYGNVWDYVDTQVQIYLPFIGFVPLDTREVMGSNLHVKYRVDVYTGTCLAQIIVQKQNSLAVLYTYAGNCSVQLPITSGQFGALWGALIAAGTTAVTAGLGGVGVGAALGAGAKMGAKSLLHGGTAHMQRSGGLGSNAGAMGSRVPYLIITHPVTYNAVGYNRQYGYPLNETVVLGSLSGYTRVKDIHLSGIPCTDDELEQIEALLKDGVIIN